MFGAPSGSATSPEIVGRDVESARVDRALAALGVGGAGPIVISGEAGIGKTRLIDDALGRAGSRIRVLRGSCLALGSGIPYLPFADLLRDLVRQSPPDSMARIVGSARADMARLLPELETALAADSSERDEPQRARYDELERLRLYEAFLRVAERISNEQPTVFVVEDVQWIDRASLELLAFLAHGVQQGKQAMLVVSVRPEESEDKEYVLTLLADLSRGSAAERIELGPLGTDATRRIATAVLGRQPDDGLVTRIQGLSDGNPLFAEELLASWQRGGPDGSLPPKLRDLLAARLAQVPDDVLEVLRVAAASGRSVDDRLLTRASALDKVQVERAVRAAVDDHILIRTDGQERPGYRFRHEILRALVASQLLPAEAQRIHAAYAQALTEEPVAQRSATEIANHWDAAGEHPRALPAHVLAGRAAVATFAFDQAGTHFERALKIWDGVTDPETLSATSKSGLTAEAASAAARSGDFDRAVALSQVLIDQRASLDPDVFELARSSLRWYLWESGDLERALAEAEAVIDDPVEAPGRWRANALGHASALLLYLRRTAEAQARATEARDLAREVAATEERILAEGVLGWCLLLEGDADAGLAAIRGTVEAAASTEDGALEGRYPVGSALAHSQLAVALELAGRLDEAYDVAIEGNEIASQQGVARTFGSVLEASAVRALYQLGRWDEATAMTTAALDAGAVGSGRISLLAMRALLAVARGRADEAQATIAEAENLVDDTTPIDVQRWLTAAVAEHAIWRGEPASALMRMAFLVSETDAPAVATPAARPAMLDASIPYLLSLGARAWADVALAERAQDSAAGLAELAGQQLRTAMSRAQKRRALAEVWAGDLGVARAELDRGGEVDAATRIRHWTSALKRVAQRPYLAAYTGWRLAEAQLARRDGRDSAAPTIEAALAITDTLAAAPLREELLSLARRARLHVTEEAGAAAVGAGSGERPYGLTVREVEVLVLLTEGLSNQDIAERLFISPKTASVHVSNIYGKLGVESRVAAATTAHALGLAATPPEDDEGAT